jgi:hypothetical protein
MANLDNVLALNNVSSVQASGTSEEIANDWDKLSSMTADMLSGILVTTPLTPVAITLDKYNLSTNALADLPSSQPLALLDVSPSLATA